MVIEVVAADADGRPLSGLSATALLAHPTDRRADHGVTLVEVASGRFQGRTGAVVGQLVLITELSRDVRRVFRSNNRVFMR